MYMMYAVGIMCEININKKLIAEHSKQIVLISF